MLSMPRSTGRNSRLSASTSSVMGNTEEIDSRSFSLSFLLIAWRCGMRVLSVVSIFLRNYSAPFSEASASGGGSVLRRMPRALSKTTQSMPMISVR